MGMEGEISRFEDCQGCTDVKIEGVGTVEDEHGWGIRALFLEGISVAQIEKSTGHDCGSTHHFHQNLSAKWKYLDLA